MTILVLLVIAGFISLILGANWLVDGASALAKKYNVSDLIIGLTIVAFGTSAPEMVVNIIASIDGHSDIVLGNVIGSNNFNLYAILGITGLILPIKVQSSTAWKEIPISIFIALLLFFLLNDFQFSGNPNSSRVDGLILLLLFCLFLFYIFKQMKKEPMVQNTEEHKSAIKIWGAILFGFAGLILGGYLVVENSVGIANLLGVSEKIISLTIIAAGTSLPELVTSVVAATKKNSDIAIGNVVGSNIFNILLILSLSSLIKPIDYNPGFNVDLYILIGGSAFLFAAVIRGKKGKLDRLESGILLGAYLFYTTYLVLQEI